MINLIEMIKDDIIMLVDKKYVNEFIKNGWVKYIGVKKPSGIYEGD